MRAYFKTMRKLKQLFRRRKSSAKFADDDRDVTPDQKNATMSMMEAAANLGESIKKRDPGWVVDRNAERLQRKAKKYASEHDLEMDGDSGDGLLESIKSLVDNPSAEGVEDAKDEADTYAAERRLKAPRDSDQGGGEDLANMTSAELIEEIEALQEESGGEALSPDDLANMTSAELIEEIEVLQEEVAGISDQGGGEDGDEQLEQEIKDAESDVISAERDGDEDAAEEAQMHLDQLLGQEAEASGERKAPDDEPSGPRKRCPKGSRKDDSGSCQKYSEAEATDPAPKKKTLRERLGAKKKCDGDCPDDNDGRQAKQFKAPPGREAQVKALKKEDVENPYAVAWSSYDAKNAESYAPICFSDNQLPGGDFDAVQNEDGTWNIGIDKDIPIMGTVHEVGVKGNEKPIGIKWLRAALRKHRDLEEQPGGAYYAPVHLRHHSENPDQDETVPAGFLRLNRIAPAFDGGDNKAAIFASLYNVPDDIYQQIKARKWAFRSVEVASWDKPQISSLSLLNTEAPFFKYGLTTIGKETPAQAVEIIPIETAAPALALCESGAGGSILFNFSEARRMAEEKIKEELEIEEDLDLNDEDVDVDVDVDEEEKDEGATLAEVAGLMRELMRRLDDEEEEIIEDTHEEVRDKRNEDVPVDIAASEGKMAAMLSELSGRVSGIESNQRKGRQRQALASYVEKSLGKLSGYNLPDTLGDTMTKMAQTAGGNYKKLLDQFVATFKATASRDEDLATLDDFEQSLSIGQGDEVLSKFAQKGEASLTNARKHLRTFKSLQDKGVRFADGVDDPANFIDILTNETNTNTEN